MKDFVRFYPATKLLTVEKCNKGPLFGERMKENNSTTNYFIKSQSQK